MANQEIYYEVVEEDEQGFNPFGSMYSSREEAERELREYLPKYPGAFIVRVTLTRLKSNRTQHLTAV